MVAWLKLLVNTLRKAASAGKLRTDEYEKDGIKRYSTKIIANEMTMLDSRSSQDNGANAGMGGGYSAAPQQQQRPQAAPMQQQAPQQQYAQKPAAPVQQQQAPQQQYAQPQQAPAAPYGQPQQPMQQAPQQAPQAQPNNSFDDFDDDIPF